jgi:hypothetical protein
MSWGLDVPVTTDVEDLEHACFHLPLVRTEIADGTLFTVVRDQSLNSGIVSGSFMRHRYLRSQRMSIF